MIWRAARLRMPEDVERSMWSPNKLHYSFVNRLQLVNIKGKRNFFYSKTTVEAEMNCEYQFQWHMIRSAGSKVQNEMKIHRNSLLFCYKSILWWIITSLFYRDTSIMTFVPCALNWHFTNTWKHKKIIPFTSETFATRSYIIFAIFFGVDGNADGHKNV